MVGGLPGKVLGLLADLLHKLQQGVITERELELFVQRQHPFVISNIQEEWQAFYQKYFRMTVDFSDVAIPDDPGGFDRVIYIPKRLTFAVVVKALRKKFKVYLYTENLDKDVVDNVRVADRNYAIRIRERQEADEELKYLSANQLKTRGDSIITLLERLVYELKYYDETGQHLDVQNWTLCAGSRYSGGLVPRVDWRSDGDKLRVSWSHPDHADARLRGRVVVS